MPQRILDIGCGLGVALLDAIARLQSLQIDAEGEDVCALGLTNLRYSAMIFNDTRTAVPGREEAQRKGLQALFEPGTLARENVAALVQRYQLNATLPWRRLLPTVFDGDYNRGLPVQTETVDFIFEQGSLKWDDPMQLPRPEVATEDYVRYFCDEVVRALASGGSAVLSVAQMQQAGYDWSWESSTVVGSRTDTFVRPAYINEARRTDVKARGPIAWRQENATRLLLPKGSGGEAEGEGSINKRRWQDSTRKRRMAPLEVVVGRVAASYSGCPNVACAKHPCKGRKATSIPTTRSHLFSYRCVVSVLYGTMWYGMWYVHKFSADQGSCAAAASKLPLFRRLRKAYPGQLVPEGVSESNDVSKALRERGRALQPNPESEWIPSTGAVAEKIFNGVRLSYRERKPCHRPAYEVGASYGRDNCSRRLGANGKPVHAHATWSDLHVYVAKRRA